MWTRLFLQRLAKKTRKTQTTITTIVDPCHKDLKRFYVGCRRLNKILFLWAWDQLYNAHRRSFCRQQEAGNKNLKGVSFIKFLSHIGRHNEKIGAAPIIEKIVETRFRWFGHVRRKPLEALVRRVD